MAVEQELFGNFVLVDIFYLDVNPDGVVELLDNSEEKKVSRFSTVCGVGPECKILKLGDEVLIPERDDGRVLYPYNGKEYAVFPETAVRVRLTEPF